MRRLVRDTVNSVEIGRISRKQNFKAGSRYFILVGVLGAIFEFAPAAVGSSATIPDRNWRRLDGMLQSGVVTSEQFELVRHLLDEQKSMITLFREHGLLSDAALQSKIREIEEVTRFSIDSLFTGEQKDRLLAWKPVLRRTSAPRP